MSWMTFCDGHFPFAVTEQVYYGSAWHEIGEWDGTTFYDPGDGSLNPSADSSAVFPVTGKWTPYPVGFTLEQMCELFWRWRHAKMTLTNLGVFTLTADSITDTNEALGTSVASGSATATAELLLKSYTRRSRWLVPPNFVEPDRPEAELIGSGWAVRGEYIVTEGGVDASSLVEHSIKTRYSAGATDSSTGSGSGVLAGASAAVGLEFLLQAYFARPSITDYPVIKSAGLYWPALDFSGAWDGTIDRSANTAGVYDSRFLHRYVSSLLRYDTYAETTDELEVKVKLGSGDVDFVVGLYKLDDSVFFGSEDVGLFSERPKLEIACDKFFTYGGIYDEATGARI
ncbi:MAG: hypothetical protein FGM22_08315 [Burkholderiaceae bacterium]|nr:hypothetical protein [Burkholderiaceae bacterium]